MVVVKVKIQKAARWTRCGKVSASKKLTQQED